jgi:hypothetical protein
MSAKKREIKDNRFLGCSITQLEKYYKESAYGRKT